MQSQPQKIPSPDSQLFFWLALVFVALAAASFNEVAGVVVLLAWCLYFLQRIAQYLKHIAERTGDESESI